MNVYLTSDLHLGHKLAARLRGFDSIQEHDDSIIQALQKVCGKKTILWILGDAAMNTPALYRLLEVPGRKKLVRGNHDTAKFSDYIHIFEDIQGIIQYKSMWLSHAPIHPQEIYRCKANIHGHIHKDAKTPELDFPYINVNWDFWKRPVSLNEIKDLVTSNLAIQPYHNGILAFMHGTQDAMGADDMPDGAWWCMLEEAAALSNKEFELDYDTNDMTHAYLHWRSLNEEFIKEFG